MSEQTTRGSYCIKIDLGIEEYIEENSAPPVAKTPPTEADIRSQKEWKTGDANAQTVTIFSSTISFSFYFLSIASL